MKVKLLSYNNLKSKKSVNQTDKTTAHFVFNRVINGNQK